MHTCVEKTRTIATSVTAPAASAVEPVQVVGGWAGLVKFAFGGVLEARGGAR
jgi:hypothetical protein